MKCGQPLLAYNLIRATIADAAVLHDKRPRQISFTSACQYVLASWMMTSCVSITDMRNHCLKLLALIASCEVANRPRTSGTASDQTKAARLSTHAKNKKRTASRTPQTLHMKHLTERQCHSGSAACCCSAT